MHKYTNCAKWLEVIVSGFNPALIPLTGATSIPRKRCGKNIVDTAFHKTKAKTNLVNIAVLCSPKLILQLEISRSLINLNETMIDGINEALGSTEQSQAFFLVEFGMTIIMLIWIVNALNKEFESGFLFLTNEAFIMLMLSAIVSQTTARFALIDEQTKSLIEITPITQFLTLDYIMIPIIIIIFF